MYRLITALLLTALSSSASAQVSMGLVCSSSSEAVPRLLTLSGTELRYFKYGEETWELMTDTVVGAEIIEGRAFFQQGYKISISRLDGSWRSSTDMNFTAAPQITSGVCVRKSSGEMSSIAANYLAQLNARRAF